MAKIGTPKFDDVRVIELHIRRTHPQADPSIKGALSYVDSKTGTTFGRIDIETDSRFEEAGDKLVIEKAKEFLDAFENNVADLVSTGRTGRDPDGPQAESKLGLGAGGE